MSEIEITTPDPSDLGVGPYKEDEIKEDLQTLPSFPQEDDGSEEEEYFIPVSQNVSKIKFLYVKSNEPDKEEEGYDPTKFYRWNDDPVFNMQLNQHLHQSDEANRALHEHMQEFLEEVHRDNGSK